MDTFTHALLGATMAAAAAPRALVRKAALAGALAGALPDADVFLSRASDPLFALLAHRHATHSLFVIPLGALVAALILRYVLRSSLPRGHLYLFCILGYASHAPLDLCTSYGTHFLWPFTEGRISWDIISIVDPAVFLLLIAVLAVSLRRKSRMAARAGLVFFACYLGAGALLHHKAESSLMTFLASRERPAGRMRVMPTLGNLVLWRGVYESGNEICADAVRVAVSGESRVYGGSCTARFSAANPGPGLAAADAGDIERFSRFADGYLALVPDHPEVLGDMRYSLLPNSLEPLWGITAEPGIRVVHFRGFTGESWRIFSGMLANRAHPESPEGSGLWKGWASLLRRLTTEAGGRARANVKRAPARDEQG
ncbi:MAG: metal-dependent hydrolase [Thermodesulfobacteriota bacterium]